LIDDALDLASVDLQVAGNGALTVARVVPIPNRVLQRRYIRCHRWCIVLRLWRGLVLLGLRDMFHAGIAGGADEHHEQFEGANQRHRWPRADQCAYRPVAQAVRQVGADRGHYADAEAPRRQRWHTLVSPACVERHHRGGPDQAIDRERQQPGGQAMLAVRADEFIGMLI
jgi:hypothetical protein